MRAAQALLMRDLARVCRGRRPATGSPVTGSVRSSSPACLGDEDLLGRTCGHRARRRPARSRIGAARRRRRRLRRSPSIGRPRRRRNLAVPRARPRALSQRRRAAAQRCSRQTIEHERSASDRRTCACAVVRQATWHRTAGRQSGRRPDARQAQRQAIRRRRTCLVLGVEVAAASGRRQSAIRSFEPSAGSRTRRRPATRPGVCQTMSNWPSAWISPISTGLVMWWFGSIFDDAAGQVRHLDADACASITLSGSVVPAFSTAFTHMLKPMTWASIGSLVTRLSGSW